MTGIPVIEIERKGITVQLTPEILPDRIAVGTAVADGILRRMAAKGDEPFLLGCPSGRTAVPVYEALARHAAAGADLSRLVIVMMDDYVVAGDDGVFRIVDPTSSYSCLGFAQRDILAPITAGAAQAGTRAPAGIWTADPADPESYDARIAAAGGIDLFLLASGDSDGHVAFNQPGTPRSAKTHIVELGEATRRDNMHTFPEFTDLAMVPLHGVTVGIDTIAGLSAEVVMMLCGENKHDAYRRLTAARQYDPEWPATIVTECRQPPFLADRAAAAVRV
jgi:glucosamine-6-phosphate deaminase